MPGKTIDEKSKQKPRLTVRTNSCPGRRPAECL